MNRVLMLGLVLAAGVMASASAAMSEGLNGHDDTLNCNFYIPNYTVDSLLAYRHQMDNHVNRPDYYMNVVNQCTRQSEQLTLQSINYWTTTGDIRIDGNIMAPDGSVAEYRQINIIK